MQKYYQDEPKFNGVYSRKNLPKIKDRAYVKILMRTNQQELIGQFICDNVFICGNNINVLIALELNIFQKKLKKHREKNTMKNIYKIQVYSSIMCGYFSIIFMLKGKSLLDYTNLYCVIYGKQRKLKNPKIRYIFEKTLVPFIICRLFKEEETVEILKILDLIGNI